ncbi:hypothetical protein QTP88_018977 [Uroleucon formosanum]
MASSHTDSPGTIYRWIERKPLTEAVTWTSREKFWLITAACHYGTHDWKSVAQVVRNAGEPYRPREWYTPKSCERQFKIIVSNLSKEVKSLPFIDMLQHIAEGLKNDYIRDANKSKDTLKSKYCNLFSVLNRVKQGNLSRNEVVNLYSQARRNEIEGKQYMDQLMTRQNASLASENSSSGLIEEPIKWNTPSAPLLTSLLRSRNTIPANRTATTIASLLQSPGGTSRTRSGKLLPLTPSIRTTQGTPTLSKLLEAPANPYISSPPQSTQKNKLSEVGTEKLANTSRKENSQSASLNRVRVDNISTLGSLNQINKSDLSASKKQISKTPVSAVKNGSKANSVVVNLLSDSETDEDTKNTIKSSFGDKKDTSSRLEPRATRSQTRAEGGFKQLNDTKLPDGKKERESLRQQSSQINETHLIDDDLLDIDQIEVEPLSSVQEEIQTQIPSKMTRSSLQRLRLSNPRDNLSTNNKVNSKEINNKMIEEISANFVANTLRPDYRCLLGNPLNSDTSECLIPIDRSACKDAILRRKDSQTSTNYDGKLLKQKGVIEIKSANLRCIDSINDPKLLSYNSHPIVVVNKIKKPFNIKFASEQRNKTNDIQVSNTDVKKPIRMNNSSLNVVKLIDSSCSLPADEVIIIDDDININEDNTTIMKSKDSLSKAESKIFPSTASNNSKSSTLLQSNEKKNETPWNMFEKPQNILDTTKKQNLQDSVTNSSNINESNNEFNKEEQDFDFEQSMNQASLSELYNGVEEFIEMHSFDNEDLNSLIDCDSLDSNESEKRMDQGDSSVSESDSTIGAFDTFAQITRVRQKSFTSKDIKDTKQSKTSNQGVNRLKESLCQSEKMYDNQRSKVSVTGIPLLQGVVSDVMSQIDLDSVASLKTITPPKIPITDVVEISSDEEATVDVPKAHPLSVKQMQTQGKEAKSYKSKEDELIQIEAKMYKGVSITRGSSSIKPLNIEMPPCIVLTNITSDGDKRSCNKLLKFKKDNPENFNTQNIEMMTIVSNSGIVKKVNKLNESEVIQPHKITMKNTNEKLMKEAKEREERKKKEDERMKQKDKDRRKKEDDERKKKIEEDRKRREFERKLLHELYERKKKEEEDRKNREDNERKKKAENERKIKELKEKMKIEERKRLQKIEKEKQIERIKMNKKLKDYHTMLREELTADENNQMAKGIVVKEEIIDECEEDILEDIIDEDIYLKSQCDEYIEDNVYDECNDNNAYYNQYNYEYNNEYNNDHKNDDKNDYDEYNDEIFEKTKMPNVIPEARGMECIVNNRSELTQTRDCELQSIEESLKSRIKINPSKRNEDLINIKELKVILPRDIHEQKEYIEFQRQSIERQSKKAEVAEIQRSKEAEKRRANEIISRKVREAEIKTINEFELERFKNHRIKVAKGIDNKKLKEAELRKNIAVDETEIKGLNKRSTLKKVKEPGNHRSSSHPEVNLLKNRGVVSSVNFKKNNEHAENNTNVEQVLIESRKSPSKDDIETFDLRERGIRKCAGTEGKTSKEIEAKSTEVKMITRTRGLKVKEKLKESNVSKNMSINLRPQIKSSGSSSFSASSTRVENPSISSYEYKKQSRNTDDNSKRNTISNISYDNKNNRDINMDPIVVVRRENLNHEVIDTPRTRTRSSSFKQKKISETKSSKRDQDNSTATIPKETVRTKTIVSTSTHPDHQTIRSKSPPKTTFNKHAFNDGGKTLIIPVVMLTTSEIPLHKVHHRSLELLKQEEIKRARDQLQKQTVISPEVDKSPPKKRGRKRRIDVQNEKLQESNSRDKTSQNVDESNASIKDLEPPSKRTRRSLALRGCNNDSSKNYTQPLSTTLDPPQCKKQIQKKSNENSEKCKRLIKYVYNNLNEKSKYISTLNKEVTDIPDRFADIIKCPVESRDIKRKIAAGEITNITELQLNLLMLSYNALMINKSSSVVYSDASNFQFDLQKDCLELKDAVGTHYFSNDDGTNSLKYKTTDEKLPILELDPSDENVVITKKTVGKMLFKYVDTSSDECTDSDGSGKSPSKKKRKKKSYDFESITRAFIG